MNEIYKQLELRNLTHIQAWIVLTEYGDNNNIIAVESTKIDGRKIKENVWYKLKNKKFIEVTS